MAKMNTFDISIVHLLEDKRADRSHEFKTFAEADAEAKYAVLRNSTVYHVEVGEVVTKAGLQGGKTSVPLCRHHMRDDGTLECTATSNATRLFQIPYSSLSSTPPRTCTRTSWLETS